jgi:hypothetical protein
MIRLKGIMLFSAPITKKAPHIEGEDGILFPDAYTRKVRITAEKPTLARTMVNGVSSRREILIKKNDAPHRMESRAR